MIDPNDPKFHYRFDGGTRYPYYIPKKIEYF